MGDLVHLPTHDEDGAVHVVVEAPRGSMIKCKYEPLLAAFVFKRALPLGLAYPYDWGFVPSTRAEDGDPLDAMVIFDQPSWPGCVIPSKPIGVVRLVQRDGGDKKMTRNDRIIALPVNDKRYEDVKDLPKRVRVELEQFFLRMSDLTDKRVKIEGWDGPKVAERLVDAAAKRYTKGGLGGG
jgi:inorganic pyrophosphatase